jgi:SWI/SNF-related matrix-associated actin-dependent regulator 1 of chromatin subfamily A
MALKYQPDNWIREIELWFPTINYTVYSGSIEERRFLRYDILEGAFEKPLNVLLATYSIINSTNDDKTFFKKLKFDYCIFDEAHMLKNMKSMRYQSLMQIHVSPKTAYKAVN